MSSNDLFEIIKKGRNFMKCDFNAFGEIQSDQELKITQPPLCKAAMGGNIVALPTNFEELSIEKDFLKIINQRTSHRVYAKEALSLLELSYLLWTTQGVKSVRGNNYATLRTVPSGGARHGFETYLFVNDVEPLKPGKYHYLPLTHTIEFLDNDTTDKELSNALSGQTWGVSSNVVFFWSIVPYRCEWRYSAFSHRIALVDIGYVSQNLYLACESIGLGTCAIGAYDQTICDEMFHLDSEDEFTILCSPVGTVKNEDNDKEQAFYAFLKDE